MFMTNMDEVTTRNGQPSARSLSSLVRDYCHKLDEVLEDTSWSWTCASAATERMAVVSEPLFTYISRAKESRDQPTDEEEQALASLREFVNGRDPNMCGTRLDFSECDAGTNSSNNPSQNNECTRTGNGMSEITTNHVSGKYSSEQGLSGLSMKKVTDAWELPEMCIVDVKTTVSEIAVATPRTPLSRHDTQASQAKRNKKSTDDRVFFSNELQEPRSLPQTPE